MLRGAPFFSQPMSRSQAASRALDLGPRGAGTCADDCRRGACPQEIEPPGLCLEITIVAKGWEDRRLWGEAMWMGGGHDWPEKILK